MSHPNADWPFTVLSWIGFFVIFFITLVAFIELFRHSYPGRKMRRIEVFMIVGQSTVMGLIWKASLLLYVVIGIGFLISRGLLYITDNQ